MIKNQQNNTIDNRYRLTDYPDIWGSRHKALKEYVQEIRWQGGKFQERTENHERKLKDSPITENFSNLN